MKKETKIQEQVSFHIVFPERHCKRKINGTRMGMEFMEIDGTFESTTANDKWGERFQSVLPRCSGRQVVKSFICHPSSQCDGCNAGSRAGGNIASDSSVSNGSR